MAKLEQELREIESLVIQADTLIGDHSFDPNKADSQPTLALLNQAADRIDALLQKHPASVVLEVTQQIATRDSTGFCILETDVQNRIQENRTKASAMGRKILGMDLLDE